MRPTKICLALLLAITATMMASCISYQSVLETGTAFEGLGKGDGEPVALIRLFFIHGMGTSGPGYARQFVTQIGESFHLRLGENDVQAGIPVDDSQGYSGLKEFPWPATLQVYRLRDGQGKIRLVAYELYWDVLTSGEGRVKQAVLGADESVPRAYINGWAKEGGDHTSGLMDNDLSDVVLYVEHYHRDLINRAAVNALGAFMAGTYDGDVDPNASVEVDLVTHSLGGIILSDALGAYWQHANQAAQPYSTVGAPIIDSSAAVEANDPKGDRFKSMVWHIKNIYMLANQIPFLSIAQMDPIPAGNASSGSADPKGHNPMILNLQTYLTPVGAAKGRVVKLIAFSDPNDLLTWQILNENSEGNPLDVVNVRSRNAFDLWGVLENPIAAHLNYWVSPKVMHFVLEGAPSS